VLLCTTVLRSTDCKNDYREILQEEMQTENFSIEEKLLSRTPQTSDILRRYPN
jgi:hypothetical protein